MTRNFNFDQGRNGQWTVNGNLFSCNTARFLVQANTLEQWNFQNGWNWSHPIHVHVEEHQVMQGAPGLDGSSSDDSSNYSRWGSQYCWSGCDSKTPTGVNLARKDTVRLVPRSNATIKMRFRDWLGRYPMHCHNVIHEDHAMMLRVKDPKWLFLTGRPDDVDLLRHKIGFADPNPEVDRDKSRHSGMLRYGNEPLAIWGTCQGSAEPEWIAQEIGFAVPRRFKRHPRVND